MREKFRTLLWRAIHLFLACLISAGAGIAHADISDTNSAASLRAKYMALRDTLSHNQFQLPLNLDSSQTSTDLKGDIYALMNYPFATVSTALKGAIPWCDILILHLNVKYCRESVDKPGSNLTVYIGRKTEQPLNIAPKMEFEYRVNSKSSDYLQVFLDAEKGPFGTKNYRFMLEAIPLKDGGTFIHLSYSYAYGFTAKLAMQAYLKTLGSDKVGFTVIKKLPDGKPLYVSGIRGALERNTMRYYLAISSYLGALSTPPQQQLEKRLRDWFTSTERYSLQLHELEQSEYLNMKRKEYKRQQAGG
ncbi:hypothetical protein [Candidatus Nitrotoga sp. 1052]|uniref:hypothetical protein n=1 Tax=Candidatus Nitrotoga sp. 1052 TaxID=2886964 RepID=UPI001EF6B13C|nr:hypothetical protein [Candidatus Nitrotoga sp. 1052]CAH1085052.1 conserved exported hypothetical protein [Candidatus Nitrotoga sp. 1052]